MNHKPGRIAFISTRIAGTDGVSLEIAKWAQVLEGLGHRITYFAGACDRPADRCYVAEEAHFEHPQVQAITRELFGCDRRKPETSAAVDALRRQLKAHLYRFLERMQPDLLIVENALSLPMNVPLGLALTEVIAETGLPTIGHHHDFAWERQRYAVNAAQDYLRAAFPPTLPSVRHVVINSVAAQQLALRAGVGSMLIPNVMDFDAPPPPPDGYAADLRAALGLPKGAYFILQPTRVVPRKRIERAIELVRRLDLPAVLVVSHSAGDEGMAYQRYLEHYARFLGVPLLFADAIIAPQRGRTADGRKIYSLADAYQAADLVTYPSAIEGFGNAFLEAVYYRKPIVVNLYEIFQTDIHRKGFQVVGFHNYITEETVAHVRDILLHPDRYRAMWERNYELGRHFYSHRVLERRLIALLDEMLPPA